MRTRAQAAAEETSSQKVSNGQNGVLAMSKARIATWNIVSARNTRLEKAIRGMKASNVDICFLTETKLTDDKFARERDGYVVTATTAASTAQGGVALVHRESRAWHLEGVRIFGPNVIRAVLVEGSRKTTMIGAYIPPNETDGATVGWIEKACEGDERPKILLGDLNVRLNSPRDAREVDIATTMANLGVESVHEKFRQ